MILTKVIARAQLCKRCRVCPALQKMWRVPSSAKDVACAQLYKSCRVCPALQKLSRVPSSAKVVTCAQLCKRCCVCPALQKMSRVPSSANDVNKILMIYIKYCNQVILKNSINAVSSLPQQDTTEELKTQKSCKNNHTCNKDIEIIEKIPKKS